MMCRWEMNHNEKGMGGTVPDVPLFSAWWNETNDPCAKCVFFCVGLMIFFQGLFTGFVPVVLLTTKQPKEPCMSPESAIAVIGLISPSNGLISPWLMTHTAVMALHALHIHSLYSSSHAPGEKTHNNESCRDTQELRSRQTRIQTLIKKDISSIAIQLCIASGSGWTGTIEYRRDGKVEKRAFSV